jgi:hypothetical protein
METSNQQIVINIMTYVELLLKIIENIEASFDGLVKGDAVGVRNAYCIVRVNGIESHNDSSQALQDTDTVES